MREIIEELEEEIVRIDWIFGRYHAYLSNATMAFFGQRKEILDETATKLKALLARYEAEAKKEQAKEKSKKS